jgi:O-antigen/teichoic acid export membrane protein
VSTAPGASGSGADGAARRVARNTAARAAAELVGKFASLALIAVLAREEGPAAVGVLVFALAWAELSMAPVEMGFDRLLLRLVARDHASLEGSFFNVLVLKLARAALVIPVSGVLVWVLDYDGDTLAAVGLLTFAFLLDTLSYTVFTTFNAVERGDLVGLALAAQRLTAAAIGVTAVFAGYGVVVVAGAYLCGSIVGFGVGMALLARAVGLPRRVLPADTRRDLRVRSRPFAGQELLSIGVSRIDVLLLSALASQTVVGYYGAAYRLLEATLFIPTALQGAFVAMYTYLGHDSEPTIRATFQRSIKLLLVLLVPCAVAFLVLPGPLLELLFGDEFGPAADALRLLGPTVVLLGVVLLAQSLMSSRLAPRRLVVYYAIALLVNVAACLLLIPSLDETGAALAMLVTELVLAVLTVHACLVEVGGIDVAATLGGPIAGAVAMAAVLVALQSLLIVALIAGTLVYGVVLIAVDRHLAPADVGFLATAARRRLPDRLFARG